MNTDSPAENRSGRRVPLFCYILLITLTLVLCTYFFSLSLGYHTYTVIDGTDQKTITSESTNPRDVITEAGFTLSASDSYTVTRESTLSTIDISRAKTVTVSYDGNAVRTDVAADDTVGSVLSLLNISLEDGDTVSDNGNPVSMDNAVYDGMCLDVSTSRELIETTLLHTPYETVTKEDPTLEAGETVIETEGADGVLQLTTSNVVVNGEVKSSTVLSAITLSAPVAKVILVGTAEPVEEADSDAEVLEQDAAVEDEPEDQPAAEESDEPAEPEAAGQDAEVPSEPAAQEPAAASDDTASSEPEQTYEPETPAPAEPEATPQEESVSDSAAQETVEAPAPSGNTITTADGTVLSYSSVMTVTATAYTGGGTTATGTAARYGEIAVDPSVIPYGTKMYIMTSDGSWVYGVATAEDCGGAIKGNIIDLYFSDYNTCIQFGRRTCTVYILN